MTLITSFINQIILNIDKRQTTLIKNEIKKIDHLSNIEFSDLTQDQKNAVLKVTDKLFNNLNLLNNDIEEITKHKINFTEFFRVIRFSNEAKFSLFWEHIQLVDDLNNDLNQQNFNKLKIFFSNLGSLKIQDHTLDDFWKESISLNDPDILAQTVFGLSLYSVLAHLDILAHQLLFSDIEPICLGWIFQKKLNSRNFQWENEKFNRINRHKGIWTNPSRSLLTLMATFAAIKLSPEEPSTSRGLNFSNYLMNYTEKKESFIKKANEGLPISYTDLLWLLSEKSDRKDICIVSFKEIFKETMNILQNKESKYEANNYLFLLWVVYRYFQNDCESRPKDTAYMHGIYFEFWEFFSNYYKSKSSNLLLKQWPSDLKELAQPPGLNKL